MKDTNVYPNQAIYLLNGDKMTVVMPLVMQTQMITK